MKNPLLLPAATLAIGALTGYFIGNRTSPAPAAAADSAPARTHSSRERADSAGAEAKAAAASRVRSTDQAYRTPGQTNRIQTLMDFYSGLSPEQLAAEADKLDDLPMSERIMASFLLFAKWGEADPLAAMAHASKMGMAGNFVRPSILQSWASTDPESAAKYYASNPREFAMMGMMGGGRGPMGGTSAASTIATEWARRDPAAAMAWAKSLSGQDQNSAMSGVIREIANTDPAKAWAEAAGMTGDSQGRAYEDIARKWGAADYAAAKAQVAALPAAQQADATAAMLEGYAKKNPELAIKEVEKLPPGDARNGAIPAVVGQLAKTDATGAAAWLVKNADAATQAEAMNDLIPNFVSQKPAEAKTFVTTGLPAGNVRDEALGSFLRADRAAPPQDHLALAALISDENQRNRTIQWTAARWLMEDATAANAYIQSSPAIPDEMKQRAASGQPMMDRGWRGGGRGGR